MTPIDSQRHGSLYLHDGNICLTSALPSDSNFESSEPRNPELERCLVFRVHKSILAMHSPVFSDMVALSVDPKKTGGLDAEYDGAPLALMLDSTQNLEVLLTAIYHRL